MAEAFLLPRSIDELRLYPMGSLMTSYTFDPIIGMTSSCDTKDEPTYYFYDVFQRLITVKNKDGNIVKQMTCH